MWGIIPAAGTGNRIQPLAFSKELLPVGSRLDGEAERPRAVSEYLIERMLAAGADRLCFVISPGKSDILSYYGGRIGSADVVYAVQPEPRGLCDALFQAAALIAPDESVLVGLPDTIWFPVDGFARLPDDRLSFLLFPVERPELFDAVLTDAAGDVREIRVKHQEPGTSWIWGGFRLPGAAYHALHRLWQRPERRDEYVGTLVNAWLAGGGRAAAVQAGEAYVDVGTVHGYREALKLLASRSAASPSPLSTLRGRPRPAAPRRVVVSGGAPARPPSTPAAGTTAGVEAVMFWNEPNNKSHWNFFIDTEWKAFSEMAILASEAVRAENPQLTQVLGGMSPIDPLFVERMGNQGVLERMDVVAVHGFPLDWNHWKIDEWPAKLEEIRVVTDLPIWVSEVGASTFGAEELGVFGLERMAELLIGRTPRIHWYSLYDLPKAWPATTRHREAEGSAYYRHFYMGLLREDGSPKPAADLFPRYTPEIGICQWFQFEDHRLDEAVAWLKRLGVTYVRTGLSWADSFRPNAEAWFDRQMAALADFHVTLTFCFTPEHRGIEPHHTSPPLVPEEYAEFCARMVRRYAPGTARKAAAGEDGRHVAW
ncbi:MAG TPA: sugar phosphate nucleotidyltransferase [Woeseiaceae bacterium]|nr:sugar phosphate nucleotidyltransferase [Woeseiaceae bacterium]